MKTLLSWAPDSERDFVVGCGGSLALHRIVAEGENDVSGCDSGDMIGATIVNGWRPPRQRRNTAVWRCSVPQLSCFDWSPRPTVTSLLAVGTAGGRLSLLRAVDGGEAAQWRAALPRGHGATTARPCSAMAWGPDAWHLAVGLDRERSARAMADSCGVLVYDCGAGAGPVLTCVLCKNEVRRIEGVVCAFHRYAATPTA